MLSFLTVVAICWLCLLGRYFPSFLIFLCTNTSPDTQSLCLSWTPLNAAINSELVLRLLLYY